MQPAGSRGSELGVAGFSLIGAVVAALASLGTAYLTGSFSVRQLEHQEVREESLERQKFSYELITVALSEPEDRARAQRLQFLVDIGLLDNLKVEAIAQYASDEVERLDQGGEGESLLPLLGELNQSMSQ